MTISTKALTATVDIPDGYVDVPAHDVVHPAVGVYSEGFETGAGGWSASSGISIVTTDQAHSGAHSMELTPDAQATRVFSGLDTTKSYTLSCWFYVAVADYKPYVWPGGSADEDFGDTIVGAWQQVSVSFTPDGSGASPLLWFTGGSASNLTIVGYIDDIALTEDEWIEHVPDHVAYVAPLDPDSGSVTLDQGWTPYGQGSLVVPLPSAHEIADAVDPRLDPTIEITPSQSQLNSDGWSDPVTRDVNLLVRGRVIDHNAETITLTLATNEAILQDAKLVATAPDLSLLPFQASVRDVCTQVLDRHSFTLEAGTADADFTTTKSAQNLHPDPACTAITYWHSASASTTMAQVAGSPNYVKGTPTSGSSVVVYIGYDGTNKLACQPGDVITVSADFDPTTVARNGIMSVRFFNAAGTQVGSDVSSGSVAYPFNAWTHASWTAVAPAGATGFTPFVNFSAVASSTAYVALRQGMILIGDTIDTDTVTKIPWFGGATATDDYYTYAWDGTANASSSTRTPRIDRTPDALTQQPGASEWDLLSTVLQQSALRLFCDELGVWRLVDGNYTVPGRVTIAEGFNAYQATDTISRDQQAGDGSPLWFDGCVIKYSWIDTTGIQQQAWDAYPLDDSATQVAYFEINGAFPGPGIAQYRVKSANGHGRTLALTAAVDYMATPGMEAVASLPGTEDQTGRVASVSWDFAADTMTVGTAGLTDTPDSAWIELDPGEEWLDSPVGGSWIGEAV